MQSGRQSHVRGHKTTAEQTDLNHMTYRDPLICSHLKIYIHIVPCIRKCYAVSASVFISHIRSVNPQLHVWDKCLVKYQQMSHPAPCIAEGFQYVWPLGCSCPHSLSPDLFLHSASLIYRSASGTSRHNEP